MTCDSDMPSQILPVFTVDLETLEPHIIGSLVDGGGLQKVSVVCDEYLFSY